MVFAHGIGGAADLPIPAELAIAGAGAALAVSFIVLALAWRTPHFDGSCGGWALPAPVAGVLDGPVFAWVLRVLGLVAFGYVAWAALVGPDLLTNPTFGVFYVLLWVGVVPASILFGRFYRAVNPARTLHLLISRATGGDAATGVVALPRWVGLWPAAIGLYAFVWLELAYPDSTYLASVRLFAAAYLAVIVLGGAVFGERWISSADPFEAYSDLVARISPWGRRDDGTLVLRNPLSNLDSTPATAGLPAVVAILLGSTAFDSFQASTFWLQTTQSSATSATVLDTLALTAFCAGVGLTFAVATMLTGVHAGDRRSLLPLRFAHSVTPIIVGYIVAHYLSYFVEVGQQTLVLLSDPLSRGDDLLGTGDWTVSYWLSEHPQFLAVTKVVAVVTGHLLGVVAAHDRAVKLLPLRHQLTGQLPLLAVMVGYTVGGLYLLFGA